MVDSRIASGLEGSRIAVIGASGFIGSRVVEELLGVHDVEVTAIARSAPRSTGALGGKGVRLVRADLRDGRALARALEGHSVAINVAHDFQATEAENRRGFENLLLACTAAGVARLVHTSSIVVYDDWPRGAVDESSPRSESGFEYKRAKVAMERMLEERAAAGLLDSIALQPTIVYGAGGWIWTESILERLESGTLILPEACDGACHAVHVEDVAQALILAAGAAATESGPAARRFIVSGPAPTTWRTFFGAYDRIAGRDSIRFEPLDSPAVATFGQESARSPRSSAWARVAQSEFVRGGLGRVRSAIGEPRVKRLRRSLLALRKRLGPIEYWPSPDEIELYRATGSCSIENARQSLGYTPRIDFESGMRMIEARR